MKNDKVIILAAFLSASTVYADCNIKVMPMGRIAVAAARNSGQIRFPAFSKFAVLKERTGGLSGDSVEFVAFDVRTRAEADRQATLAATGGCRLVPRPLCQMNLEAPNKVKVKMTTLVNQGGDSWQPQFSDVISVNGANASATVLQNLELFRSQKAALGCDWDAGLGECSITRNFNSARKRPQYHLRLGSGNATGLINLTYERSNELMGQLGSSMDFSAGSGAGAGPSCRFTDIPGDLECSIAPQGSGFVVRFGTLGSSERFTDREAACQLLTARASAGECRTSSSGGEEVCTHAGVRSGGARPSVAPSKLSGDAAVVPGPAPESEER